METALNNLYSLLKKDGILLIDTKKYIKSDDINGTPTYKELRYLAKDNEWIERYEREEKNYTDEYGELRFHTRLMYDFDPSFSIMVRRALILLTIYGEKIYPRTNVIPYYPLPSKVLEKEMEKVGFKAKTISAMEGLAKDWKYDIVIGQKI